MQAPDQDKQFVSFRMNQTLMGISILDIREIVPVTRMTRVQKAPPHIAGLLNLRGRILTVFDVGVLLGWPPARRHENSHVMVFKHRDVGFMVDDTGDVITPPQAGNEPVPANLSRQMQQYVRTVLPMPGEVMVVLDANRILTRAGEQKAGL